MKRKIALLGIIAILMFCLAGCAAESFAPATAPIEKVEAEVEAAEEELVEVTGGTEASDFSIMMFDDGTCEISACTAKDKVIHVPEIIDGKEVIGIGFHAFEECPAEIIILPDSVRYINAYAFNNCENLTSLELGNGLKSVGSSFLNGCPAIKELSFPEGMTTIEHQCFGSCRSLKNVYIPASVTEIPEGITITGLCPSIKIITPSGSVAESAAWNDGLPVSSDY